MFKNITAIEYNYLNLPTRVVKENEVIEWLYDAAGQKVQKKVGNEIRWYIGGMEYKSGTLEALYHEEGRVTKNGLAWQFEYTLSDHLGNARVSFTDSNNDGSIDPNTTTSNELLQTQSGVTHSGIGNVQVGSANLYQFQGQELQTELGWSQFKWRNADPTIGRFFSIDPIAEDYYYNSTYAFSENKLTAHIELEGLEAVLIHGTKQSDCGKVFSSDSEKQLQRIGGNTYTDDKFSWDAPQLNRRNFKRKKAAKRLKKHVSETRKRLIKDKVIDSSEPITLIGYSHGGNVALQVIDQIAEEFGVEVNLITISTPAYNNGDHSENASNKEGIASHIQVVHENDLVTSTIALGNSDSEFNESENHSVTNIVVTNDQVEIDGGGVNAHTKFPGHEDLDEVLKNIPQMKNPK